MLRGYSVVATVITRDGASAVASHASGDHQHPPEVHAEPQVQS
ncbi:hypothetical protein STRAU_2666 [Streptomyces aurantiacus JA 4570]|uniref:Uncharacterized protein n=1 Tax=Streptomyces aurantiacus JA 4570 TaxID=1286094 RepID=S3ZL36_9ACTN|nr:hypothetical protein STRAU_2666 [Streptomyces aurantiacus JA 4570]